MKTNYKISTVMAVIGSALLFTTSCHDDLESSAPRFDNNGLHGLMVGVQNEWTAETRAAHSSVTLLQPDALEGTEPLVVIVEDELTGDTTISSRHRQAAARDTRGVRYVNETEGFDGETEQHYMHESFALFGMLYSGEGIRPDFTNATLWDVLKTEPGTDYETVYSVLRRPDGSHAELTEAGDAHYEEWSWGSIGEKTWPAPWDLENGGGVMLFALAPAQTDADLGIRVVAESGAAPYFDYEVPEMIKNNSDDPVTPIFQQDLMVAKRCVTKSMIEQTIDQDQTSPDVQLDFQHICTAVKFRIADEGPRKSNKNTKIKSITMKDVVSKARYTFSNTEIGRNDISDITNPWTLDKTKKADMTYDFSEPVQWNEKSQKVEEKTLTNDDNVFMMIPQSFGEGTDYDNPQLEVTITYGRYENDTEVEEVTLSTHITHTWKPGHTVTYTIAKAEAVTIEGPFLDVKAVYNTAGEEDENLVADITDGVDRTPVSTIENNGIVTGRTYTIEWSDDDNDYIHAKHIAFKVDSYKRYKIGDSETWNYVDIPWTIEQTTLGSNTYDTDKKHELPKMVEMTSSGTADVINPETGLLEAKQVPLTWGDGGNPYDGSTEKLPFIVNPSSRRGVITGSDAINSVLSRSSIGTEEAPQDLSMLSLDGTPTDAQNTANCYVISAPGYYLIPLVYGNAILNGEKYEPAYKYQGTAGSYSLASLVDHKGAAITSPYIYKEPGSNDSNDRSDYEPTSAEVIWSTSPDIITDIKVTTDKQYISFKVDPLNINLGNVLLAVKHGNTVLWSWHLWVNDYDEVNKYIPVQYGSDGPQYNFMEVNLGWTDAYNETFSDSTCVFTFKQQNETGGKTFTLNLLREHCTKIVPGTGGTYYQYGRKDPFPSVAVSLDQYETIYPLGSDNTSVTLQVKAAEDMMFQAKKDANGKYIIQNGSYVFDDNRSKYLYNRADPGQTNQPTTGLPNIKSGYGTIANGIQNPGLLYLPTSTTNTNWFNGYYNNLWTMMPYTLNEKPWSDVNNIDYDVYKTVYDPCPTGYCIPNPGAFKGIYTLTEDDKDFTYKYSIEPDNILINGTADYSGNEAVNGITLKTNEIKEAAGWNQARIIEQIKSDIKLHGYTATEPEVTNDVQTNSKTDFDKSGSGKFAHANTSKVEWMRDNSEFQNNNPKYNGIEGLLYDGKLFLPSAGMRNPAISGATVQDGHSTFNYGGYYATAFSAPDITSDGGISDNENNLGAATFFWIQRKRVADELGKQILSVDDIPLFDPYNKAYDDYAPRRLWVYRYDNYPVSFLVVYSLGVDQDLCCWGANGNIGGWLISRILQQLANPAVRNAGNGVWVHFRKKVGPLPYTPHEWARERSYGMSVRPIRDAVFDRLSSGGIAISNDGGESYRNTLSRRRK